MKKRIDESGDGNWFFDAIDLLAETTAQRDLARDKAERLTEALERVQGSSGHESAIRVASAALAEIDTERRRSWWSPSKRQMIAAMLIFVAVFYGAFWLTWR